jgi:hypothetical protein
MWLACGLIVLFSIGFVLPCMLDITTTPDSEFTTLSKGMWLMIAGAFWIFGAAAWLIVGRPQRPSLHNYRPRRHGDVFGATDALLRHPAAQAAGGYAEPGTWVGVATSCIGPDDDEAFIAELGRRIREAREEG